MPKFTPSIAKNHMLRTFTALLDPLPSDAERDALWEYFKSSCAYCGKKGLVRGHDHIDHLVAHAEGGTNSIYNGVLACKSCNQGEKREMDWKAFLRLKSRSPEAYARRKAVIDRWRRRGARRAVVPVRTRKAAEVIAADAIRSFDNAVRRIRELRG